MNQSQDINKVEEDGITYFIKDIIEVDNKKYRRIAVQTHFVERKEDYIELVNKYIAPIKKDGDILSVSEKIISMCQDNTVEMKDVKVGFWARFLSKFATRTTAGIGMDEPYKLQLAIDLKGLPLVLYATFRSAIGKLFGKRGIFYEILGKEVAGIDGFYDRSSFDTYHTLAVLMPKDPDGVCEKIKKELSMETMVVDANDFDQDIWGRSSGLKEYTEDTLKGMIKDNPAGQSDEMTPFILIREVKDDE